MAAMYGTGETDPLVRYYDETLAVTSSREADWYLERARCFGGPVLHRARCDASAEAGRSQNITRR